MAYVIYDIATTKIVVEKRYGKEKYATEAAAKAARTRITKKQNVAVESLGIAELTVYRSTIAAMVERVNLLSGKKYLESINTPLCCSPASETYHSM
jgi:p-aminobenzoyl-glutamate transporter AbgT